MKDGHIIETERLLLRRMADSDLPDLKKMLKDERTMYAYEHAFSDEECADWLSRQQKRYADHGFGLFAVALKETGEIIGQCGVTIQETPLGTLPEVGYIFNRDHWRKGYATEAARAARDYAFDVLGFDEVYSIIRDDNAASIAVAKRNGMTEKARMTKYYYGKDMPHIIFSVKKEELYRLEEDDG